MVLYRRRFRRCISLIVARPTTPLHHQPIELVLRKLMLVARQQPCMTVEGLAELCSALVDVRPSTISFRRYRRLSAVDRRHRRTPDRRRIVHDGSSATRSMVVGRTGGVDVVAVRSSTTGVWLPKIQRDAVAGRRTQ